MASDLLRRVFELLSDDRVELRCAAALVLGTAGRGDERVARALVRLLGDSEPAAVRFALEGLEAHGVRDLGPELAPLLSSSDEEVRTRALRLLAAQGARGERVLVEALAAGSPSLRHAVVGALVKRGTARAIDALLDELADGGNGEHVLHLLRAELDHGTATGRAVAARAVDAIARLEEPPRGRARRGGDPPDDDATHHLAQLLRLVGYAGDPQRLPLLVAHAAPGRPAPVRIAAIAGMRRAITASEPPVPVAEAAIAALIEHADDPDPAVARTAVDSLRGAPIPQALVRRFAALAKGRHPEAQKLALERLPALGARAAIPRLVAAVTGVDHGAREAATRALAAAPEAAGPLAESLADAADEGVARRLAQALVPHEARVPARALGALAARAARALEDDHDRVGHLVLDTFARVAPEQMASLLFTRAARLREAGHYPEAFASLRPLAHSGARLDPDQRFTMAVLGLKAAGKDSLRSARAMDPLLLLQFRQLADAGYPVAAALARQKDVADDDIFALGFHLIEAPGDDDKELGRELLEAVIRRQPRGKLAAAARNKLRLEG